MRVYLPRFYVRGLGDNLAAMQADCAEAAELGCEAVMFPEQFLTGYYGENDAVAIRQAFAAASNRYPHMLCSFGTISEDGVNRQLLYLAGGEVARYDKVHLFEPNGEHKLWQRAAGYSAVEWGAWRIGLCTCNDVRFPEQARALKLKYDINLLTYPSLWPWARDQVYAALLRARAIENGVFCIGCCVAGVDNGAERFDGAGNHVYDPLGAEIFPTGRVYELDATILDRVLVDTRAQYREISEIKLYSIPE